MLLVDKYHDILVFRFVRPGLLVFERLIFHRFENGFAVLSVPLIGGSSLCIQSLMNVCVAVEERAQIDTAAFVNSVSIVE
jgi:ABC-type uncharacterized transport system permease subunit